MGFLRPKERKVKILSFGKVRKLFSQRKAKSPEDVVRYYKRLLRNTKDKKLFSFFNRFGEYVFKEQGKYLTKVTSLGETTLAHYLPNKKISVGYRDYKVVDEVRIIKEGLEFKFDNAGSAISAYEWAKEIFKDYLIPENKGEKDSIRKYFPYVSGEKTGMEVEFDEKNNTIRLLVVTEVGGIKEIK